ncbi:O-antigen ligase family protein [Ornithinimicrobium ciconiae]|uniref:O-antigen ligase family protein n=1 Tax=Ornithinimicrobium ciconiae TaxID=2594265 RepID=A0A516G7D5_9MICO|nr:O-antigen ligase family protein [Ornithinimicrobium ciconiae]QDO87419.1 O-antigen ligase family protein [Ornithinimicrobium ciconiae]
MMHSEWMSRALLACTGVAALVIAVGVGYASTTRPTLALLAAAIVAVAGATVAQPAALPALAFALVVVTARVAVGPVDLTVSDVALGVSFWPALFMSPRPFSRELRQLLWLNAIYQTTTLFTVIQNPFTANRVEWVHAWLLVSGALIIGWAAGRAGLAKTALALLLLSSGILAAGTVVQGVTQWAVGDFSPVFPQWPYPMHKNAIGCILGFSAVIAYARPSWLGWPRWGTTVMFWLSVTGIGAAQSRQAMVGLAIGLVVVSVRNHPERRRSLLILLGIAPVLAVVATMVRDQLASDNIHNSAFQRLTWFEESIEAWQQNPWVGTGLRYWYTDTQYNFQPPNGILEVLATAGVVGLVGFLIMMIGSLVVLWRLDKTYGTLAFALLLSRLVQGQLDLFWVAVQTSIPFLVAGLCLGLAARAAADSRPRSTPTQAVPAPTGG